MSVIFVVDDDPDLLRGLDVALSGRGHAVRTAPSGRALLALMETESPDLLVVDVMMPEMSGIDVLREIRADGRWTELPVMLVTAAPDGALARSAREGGAAEVIPKPFRLRELVHRIESRLAD